MTKMNESEKLMYTSIYRDLCNAIIKYTDKDLYKLGKYAIHTDFYSYLPNLDCYSIHDLLVKHKVVRKKAKFDHEYSCCYYYFSTNKAALTFVHRFAEFMIKRNRIKKEYGF